MKFIDILTNVDKSDKNKHDRWSSSFTWLQDYLDIPNYGNLDQDKLEADNKLNLYWLTCWLCTDTYVGSIVIYFEGKPAGILYKSARKSSADAKFISSELKKKIKAYLIELAFMQEPEPEQEDDDIILDCELADDESPYYKISYPCQILEEKALLDNSVPVTLCPHAEQNHKWDNFEEVKVSIDETGEKKTVNIYNLTFAMRIHKPVETNLVGNTFPGDFVPCTVSEIEEPEEFRLTGKEVWRAATEEQQKELDDALGLKEIKLKINASAFDALEEKAKLQGIILKALVRQILTDHVNQSSRKYPSIHSDNT